MIWCHCILIWISFPGRWDTPEHQFVDDCELGTTLYTYIYISSLLVPCFFGKFDIKVANPKYYISYACPFFISAPLWPGEVHIPYLSRNTLVAFTPPHTHFTNSSQLTSLHMLCIPDLIQYNTQIGLPKWRISNHQPGDGCESICVHSWPQQSTTSAMARHTYEVYICILYVLYIYI